MAFFASRGAANRSFGYERARAIERRAEQVRRAKLSKAEVEERAGLPIVAFADAAALDRWLEAQPESSPGLWIKFAKAGSGIGSVSRTEAIEAALYHGWIDGQLAKYDDKHWLVRFTPHSPQQVVTGEPHARNGADRGWANEPTWTGADRSCQIRREMGRGLRAREQSRGAARRPGSAG